MYLCVTVVRQFSVNWVAPSPGSVSRIGPAPHQLSLIKTIIHCVENNSIDLTDVQFTSPSYRYRESMLF